METNPRKFTVLSFVLASGLIGYVLYLALTLLVDSLRMGGSNVFGTGYSWVTIGGTFAGIVGVSFLIGFLTSAKATNFVDEVFVELFKTTWPTPKETTQSTVVVSIMVTVAAIILMVMDSVWDFLFRKLI